ncbi:MAG: TIGR03013 family PEP-CTERM/XrtA system glycosyltransferase [Desulfobacteraceae bacterium]|nr:MAG: TIGR03013 family PEP-CTERM/XrtA system glycosyltransferase [Desulfobacteraceae bacterium]
MNMHLPLVIGDTLFAGVSVYTGLFFMFHLNGSFRTIDLRQLTFFIIGTIFVSYFLELYNLEKQMHKREFWFRIFAGLAGSLVAWTVIHYLIPAPLFLQKTLLTTLILFGIFQSLWHLGYQSLLNSSYFTRKVLILGTGPLAKKIGDLIGQSNRRHVLGGYYYLIEEPISVPISDILVKGNDLFQTAKKLKINKIVVSLTERRGAFPLQEVLDCKFRGIEVVDAPSFYEYLTGKLMIEDIKPSWFIFADAFRVVPLMKLYKRAFDFVFSLIGLGLTLPFLPLMAFLIKMDSQGPVFYKQLRVGQMDTHFYLYKLRTMRRDAERSTGAVWAQENDPRITRLGWFLRKTRIDELPQLYNVLIGDMSFVGPRPERPEFVEKLKSVIPYYSERHFVKTGITGWAQIRYPYGASEKDALEKLRYDLYYIKNMSIFLDFSILLETIKVMLFGRGAR